MIMIWADTHQHPHQSGTVLDSLICNLSLLMTFGNRHHKHPLSERKLMQSWVTCQIAEALESASMGTKIRLL